MSDVAELSPAEAKKRRHARMMVALIGTVAVLPIVGSFLLYQFWRPSSFVNHGELIPPSTPMVAGPQDPMAPTLKSLSGKWVLVTLDSGACGQDCQQKLYYLRQVRLTQGKEMERIERLWILTDTTPAPDVLLKEHPGLKVVPAQGSEWVAMLPLPAPAASYVFILDPLGNIVLRYPKGFDPTGMKKDLGRLLRASRIG